MAVSESGESESGGTEGSADPEPERQNRSTAAGPLDAFGRWIRIAAGLGGVVVFGLAVIVTVVPGAVEPFVESAIERLGNDYFVVAAVGVVALWLALLAAALRGITRTKQSSPPAVEGVQTAPPPGAAFDEALEAASGPFGGDSNARRELEDRLQNAAVETLMRVENCSRPAAEQRLEADDSEFTDGLERGTSTGTQSAPERLVDAVRGKTVTSDDVTTAVRELERLSERGPTRSAENDRRGGESDEEGADRTESGDSASKKNPHRASGDSSSVSPDQRGDAIGP